MKLSRIAAYAWALVLAVALSLTGAGVAAAATQAAGSHYVALGDSYSSGLGVRELRQFERQLQALHQGLPGPVGGGAFTRLVRLHRVLRRSYG